MRNDIRLEYEQALEASHHGRPTVVETVHTGRRGRPRIEIDPSWLQWAHDQRTTAGVGNFLNVSRTTVRNALLDYGISTPQPPFLLETNEGPETDEQPESSDLDVLADDLLNPDLPVPTDLPDDVHAAVPPPPSTGNISSMTNEELDGLIMRLRMHFRRAGISMLHGMLRRLGHRVQQQRIRQSLLRVDPVQRVFDRIRIRRREYRVAGPNALWHHDGQHGE